MEINTVYIVIAENTFILGVFFDEKKALVLKDRLRNGYTDVYVEAHLVEDTIHVGYIGEGLSDKK